MTLDELSNECKKVITDDKFAAIDKNTLDEWTQLVITNYLDSNHIKWKITSIPCGVNVVKIDDKLLKYVIIMPYKAYDEQKTDEFYFMIGDDPNNDHDSIHASDVASYLLYRV